jgi:hypothetical protein
MEPGYTILNMRQEAGIPTVNKFLKTSDQLNWCQEPGKNIPLLAQGLTYKIQLSPFQDSYYFAMLTLIMGMVPLNEPVVRATRVPILSSD